MEPAAAVVMDKGVKKANIGFILGLVSVLAWLFPIIGLPVTLCGIIFSTLGLSSAARSKAKVGLVLSILFLVITVLNAILGASLAIVTRQNDAALQGTVETK